MRLEVLSAAHGTMFIRATAAANADCSSSSVLHVSLTYGARGEGSSELCAQE